MEFLEYNSKSNLDNKNNKNNDNKRFNKKHSLSPITNPKLENNTNYIFPTLPKSFNSFQNIRNRFDEIDSKIKTVLFSFSRKRYKIIKNKTDE